MVRSIVVLNGDIQVCVANVQWPTVIIHCYRVSIQLAIGHLLPTAES